MNRSPSPADLAAAFGLESVQAESLSPWSPVHRGRARLTRATEPVDVVVKLTARSAERAAAMAAWTRALAAAGVPVVAPVDLPVPNPAPLGAEGHWYVVYPYVAGRPAGHGDAAALGDLLGRLHAAPVPAQVLADLRPYAFPQTSREDVEGDVQTLRERLPAELGPEEGARAVAAVEDLGRRWFERVHPALRAADAEDPLPRTGVSSDFKAGNVVMAESGPVLVDPDNGGCEPRLFDLAMAAVLLHHDSPAAPGRLPTRHELAAFFAAYGTHVRLTARERALWPLAVDHMLWEEGTWALEDSDTAAYADARQGGYLRALATATPEDLPLGGV